MLVTSGFLKLEIVNFLYINKFLILEKVAPATKEKKREAQPIMCEDPDLSDKDEAEGDDSELDSDDSEEHPPTPLSVENNSNRPPIRQ